MVSSLQMLLHTSTRRESLLSSLHMVRRWMNIIILFMFNTEAWCVGVWLRSLKLSPIFVQNLAMEFLLLSFSLGSSEIFLIWWVVFWNQLCCQPNIIQLWSARSLAGSGTPHFRSYMRAARSGPLAVTIPSDDSSSDDEVSQVHSNKTISQPRPIRKSVSRWCKIEW